MEFPDEFSTGIHYLQENGRLHVYTENIFSSGFSSRKHIKYRDYPSATVTVSDNVVQPCPCDNVLSLFELCLSYLSTNVQNITSLVGFPDIVGEKIFGAVRNRRILQTLADHECALVLHLFDEAYGTSMLEQLSVKSLTVLEKHIESFSAFGHVTKLDVTGCILGDNHDYLLHIGHLPL